MTLERRPKNVRKEMTKEQENWQGEQAAPDDVGPNPYFQASSA
jgi:hypothetical protein